MCLRCTRPAAACICRWITPVPTSVDLLILQHPMEVHNAKGSARLLHLSIPGSRLIVGERFEQDRLASLLHAGSRMPVLLYPETPDDRALGLPPAPPLGVPPRAEELTLVILDGTWRKSRKMLYLNPALQGLPRLPLRDVGQSRYLIRKAHAPDQLSTLEAACLALGQIEGTPARYEPLSDSFADFVAVFASRQGRLNPA